MYNPAMECAYCAYFDKQAAYCRERIDKATNDSELHWWLMRLEELKREQSVHRSEQHESGKEPRH